MGQKVNEVLKFSPFRFDIPPCRFLPLFQIFQIYKESGKKDLALQFAKEIVNKRAKIPSLTVNSIKEEAQKYLKEN